MEKGMRRHERKMEDLSRLEGIRRKTGRKREEVSRLE